MNWITRERVNVDRVACPWLIKRFVDSDAELFCDALYTYCQEMMRRGKPDGNFK